MRIALAALLALAPAAARAQFVGTPHLSGFQQQITALQQQIPAPCSSVPMADTLAGSLGTGPCTPNATASRPTVIQAGIVTTDASGAWSISWSKAFASATPYINAQPVNPSALQPATCNVVSSTATGATGKCWMQTVLTLPGVSLSLLNLQLVGAAASMQVRVAARDLTQ